MATTLMGELEALRLRCDRLSASREERAQEADKNMARLREVKYTWELRAKYTQRGTVCVEANVLTSRVDGDVLAHGKGGRPETHMGYSLWRAYARSQLQACVVGSYGAEG